MPKRYRTLLVEDDRLLRLLNRTLLEQSGKFEVVGEAEDGAEAIEKATLHKPDVILLDLVMPGTDGFKAIPRIRKATPSSCVIVVSMLPRMGTEDEVVRLGAAAFVDKAEDSEHFLRQVLAALEEWTSSGAKKSSRRARTSAQGADA